MPGSDGHPTVEEMANYSVLDALRKGIITEAQKESYYQKSLEVWRERKKQDQDYEDRLGHCYD